MYCYEQATTSISDALTVDTDGELEMNTQEYILQLNKTAKQMLGAKCAFDKLATDVDVAMERAMALPKFILLEDDDIVKEAAFRFHYIAQFSLIIFVLHYHCNLHS